MKSTQSAVNLKLTESRWKATVAADDIKSQSFPGANAKTNKLETLNELTPGPKVSNGMPKPTPTKLVSLDLLSPRKKPVTQADLVSIQLRIMNLEIQIASLIQQNKLLIQQNSDFKNSIDKKIVERIEMSRERRDDLSFAERSEHGHRKPSPVNKSMSKSTIGQREPDQLAPPVSIAHSPVDRKDDSHISEEPSKGLTDRTAREHNKQQKNLKAPSSCWSWCCLLPSNKITKVSPSIKGIESNAAVSYLK